MTPPDTGAAAGPPQYSRATGRTWLALALLMVVVFIVSIDNTALTFALPEIGVGLNVTAQQMLWIVDIYPLVLASLLLTMGVVGDRVGRRRLLMTGTGFFGVLSVAAAFAPSATALILLRGALGFFGAMLMPSTLALIRNLFHDPEQRRLAIAIWAACFAGGGAVGPIIGGWLVEQFWWGAIFLMAAPACLLLVAGAPFLLPESRSGKRERLDPLSVLLSIVALLCLTYGVKHLTGRGADALVVVLAVVMLATCGWFIRRQLTRPDALLDLRLFKRPIFAASIGANFASMFGFAGLVFFLSQHLQFVGGLGPMEAAILMVPGAIASIVLGLGAVWLARLASLASLVVFGMLLGAGGFVLAATISVDSPAWLVMLVFVLCGAGVGLAETLTNDAIIAAVDPQKAGAASAISETSYELGAAMGIAVLGSIANWRYLATLRLPKGTPAALEEAALEGVGTATAAAQNYPGYPGGVAGQVLDAVHLAFDHGVTATAIVGAVLIAAAAVGAGIALRGLSLEGIEDR